MSHSVLLRTSMRAHYSARPAPHPCGAGLRPFSSGTWKCRLRTEGRKIVPDNLVDHSATKNMDVLEFYFAGVKIDFSERTRRINQIMGRFNCLLREIRLIAMLS